MSLQRRQHLLALLLLFTPLAALRAADQARLHGPKRAMFADIGRPEWLLDLDAQPADDVFAALLAIHQDYPAAMAKVKTAMAFVRDQQAETMRVVKSSLKP